jgi:four helix bundle protein
MPLRHSVEKPWDLRERTMLFAISVIRLCRSLPATREAAEIANQLRRAGSSIAAQYRAATRNKSDDDYISKVGGAIEEADETIFWLDLLSRTEIVSEALVRPLRGEANELVAILVVSRTRAVVRRARAKQRVAPLPRQSG